MRKLLVGTMVISMLLVFITSQSLAESCQCDLNGDGKCNILDYQLFIQDWGRKDFTVGRAVLGCQAQAEQVRNVIEKQAGVVEKQPVQPFVEGDAVGGAFVTGQFQPQLVELGIGQAGNDRLPEFGLFL